MWTGFTSEAVAWLDHIPGSGGTGTISVTVPMFYRVVATVPPEGMVLIPAGTFMMGNATNVFPANEGNVDELPQHEVHIDAIYIDKYEVTQALWNSVFTPAYWLGYTFSNNYNATLLTRPMIYITWYDAIKWCNARSELEGLTPVYYIDDEFSEIYKIGEVVPNVNWSANGYRLPTEAEWEKAARGGVPDTRFPWSDINLISHEKANYYADLQAYDLSSGFHPAFYNNGFTTPAGYFSPNDFSLYDMAGNVAEWVWDRYDANYYSISPVSNPRGPETGDWRIVRGGSYGYGSTLARCSARFEFPPTFENIDIYGGIGFRCVRKP